MRRYSREILLSLLLGAALCTALPSAAEARKTSKKEAKALFKEGQRHFKAGEFAEALDSFDAAYAIKPHPDILFMIAQCHRNLLHFRQAIDGFKGYLRDKPEAQDREEVEQLILDLEREDAEQSPPPEKPAKKKPPPPAIVAPVTPLVPPPPPRREETPVYQKWWFWAIIGGVAAAGTGIGLGVYFGTRSVEVPAGSLGSLDLR
jgi:tetratricopeptide (TPR) repeat protein